MYYDKFELGGTYEGSIETKECKQKVPSEIWCSRSFVLNFMI